MRIRHILLKVIMRNTCLQKQQNLASCQTYKRCVTDEHFATIALKKSAVGFSYTELLNSAIKHSILFKLQNVLSTNN